MCALAAPHRWTRGPWLTGRENQLIRFLIDYCQTSLTAINGAGPSATVNIMFLAGDWPLYKKSLLAAAARVLKTSQRPGMHDTPDVVVLDYYQSAMEELSRRFAGLYDPWQYSADEILELMATTNTLAFFGFDRGDHTWPIHSIGSLRLAELLEHHGILNHPVAEQIRKSSAHLDISAFTIGRGTHSSRVWLKWEVCPINQYGRPLDPAEETREVFTSREVSTGYPESLITVIATISAWVDQQVTEDATSPAPFITSPDSLEQLALGWRRPRVPSNLDATMALCLNVAWETIRKAALIFIWRGKGFHSDLTQPIPEEEEGHAATKTLQNVHGILYSIDSLVHYSKTHAINVANAMLWPLMVAASEVSHDRRLQESTLTILEGLRSEFGLGQIKHIRTLLQRLWEQVATAAQPNNNNNTTTTITTTTTAAISLESTARSIPVCIPIY